MTMKLIIPKQFLKNELVFGHTIQEDDEDDWQHALSLAGEIEGIPWVFHEFSQSTIPERLPAYAKLYHNEHWELVKIENKMLILHTGIRFICSILTLRMDFMNLISLIVENKIPVQNDE